MSSSLPPERFTDREAPLRESPSRAHALDACRSALHAYTGDPRGYDAVRAAIQSLAHAARVDQVTPEQMLIELKTVLNDVAAFRGMASVRAESARTRLVSVAIRAYYGEED